MATEADAADRRRAVEALAQALYEASDPGGVSWARRPRIVREPWLLVAENQITGGGASAAGAPQSGAILGQEGNLLLRLKLEQTRDGLTATLSKRGEDGKPTEPPTVFRVADKEEAKRRARALARALGLRSYGLVDKTGADSAAEAAAPDAPPETT